MENEQKTKGTWKKSNRKTNKGIKIKETSSPNPHPSSSGWSSTSAPCGTKDAYGKKVTDLRNLLEPWKHLGAAIPISIFWWTCPVHLSNLRRNQATWTGHLQYGLRALASRDGRGTLSKSLATEQCHQFGCQRQRGLWVFRGMQNVTQLQDNCQIWDWLCFGMLPNCLVSHSAYKMLEDGPVKFLTTPSVWPAWPIGEVFTRSCFVFFFFSNSNVDNQEHWRYYCKYFTTRTDWSSLCKLPLFSILEIGWSLMIDFVWLKQPQPKLWCLESTRVWGLVKVPILPLHLVLPKFADQWRSHHSPLKLVHRRPA